MRSFLSYFNIIICFFIIYGPAAWAEQRPVEKPPLFLNFCEKAVTPADKQACTQKRFESTEDILNTQFQSLLKFFVNTPHAERLTIAQNGWIAYRNKECSFEAGFFEEDAAKRTIELGCLSRLSELRALELYNFIPRVRQQKDEKEEN